MRRRGLFYAALSRFFLRHPEHSTRFDGGNLQAVADCWRIGERSSRSHSLMRRIRGWNPLTPTSTSLLRFHHTAPHSTKEAHPSLCISPDSVPIVQSSNHQISQRLFSLYFSFCSAPTSHHKGWSMSVERSKTSGVIIWHDE